MSRRLLVLAWAGLGGVGHAAATPSTGQETLAREEVRQPFERAIAWLVEAQAEDGSIGTPAPECIFETGFAPDTYRAWQVASQALACMALAAAPSGPVHDEALAGAVDWLCTVEVPKRGSDWDTDHTWSALYGFVALVELAGDPRLVGPTAIANGERAAAMRRRGHEFYRVLERQQAVSGGWAYYDGPPFLRRPTWATSFCTALLLPALVEARELGWAIDPDVIERGLRYLQRCELPGGAYSYDLRPRTSLSGVEHINRIEGSLGRTQVANWARLRLGDPKVTPDVLRAGIEAFFKHRRYLDQVRTRPIPHEGFHQNAGYFYFFGHYYVALAIELLPESEREFYHARLRPHLVKTQFENGGASDFLDSTYLITASTSYLALALGAGLPEHRPGETERPRRK